ncbi:Inward rectifier potassium channel C-terminal domain [Phytophthora infestans]|uniref:Inward rectifier potassium channel C-terminal domain n=1 Tax=Phytophthora infestans TaxID=4787 RepID=A0A833WE86_PHYIN|nr:Inward rectifier potassium channel C-terminal domain [Phytophthora infestans]KAF4143554.1 Inward rectifier potassium channel C-terminal domain [Phytophthora infestans]
MPPSKNHSIPSRSPGHQQRSAEHPCPCTFNESSSGICDLNVWQGTTLDDEAAQSGKRLLRPNLPVIKCKHWTQLRFPARLYHLVSIGWIPLLCVFIGVYVAVVGVFALLFAACYGLPKSSENARNYFNLSLQTLSSCGYGDLSPANTCSRLMGGMESFLSMLLVSFMTGVAFVKFARPHPTIAFSNVFTVSRGESGLEMRFRVANETHRDLASKGDIIDVGFKLILMRIETGQHGEKRLCYYDLKLNIARIISLRLEIELIHTIDTTSPFIDQTSDDVERSDFVLILLASGLDENLHDIVHKKYEYSREAMRWSAKFLPMLDWDSHHKFIELDLHKISAVTPLVNNSAYDHAIDMDITSFPVQDKDSSSSSSCNESNRELVRNTSYSSSRDHQAEDIISHKMADGSLCGISDNHDNAAAIQRLDKRGQHNEDEPESKCHSASGRPSTPPRSTQRQRRDVSRSYRHHDHDFFGKEQPMSLLQRRVRVKNRSCRLLLNGIYQRALAASWPNLLLCLIACYLAVVATIALIIAISIHEPLTQRTQNDFGLKYGELFFFCVQTISTVGYGTLSPRQNSDVANFFVFLLIFSGLFVSTLVTGITWAKFSIPKASTLLYSDFLLLTTFHSHRAVMFRAASNRKFGVLVEGSFRMTVIVLDRNFGRRETHELHLVRNVWPIINLCNTLTHIIDESSPLYHLSTSELLSGDHFFVVLFTGQDDVISDTMVARKAYHACDILVDHHFEDNITLTPDGLYIDLDAINATYCDSDLNPIEEPDRSPSSVDPATNNDIDSPHSSYKLIFSSRGFGKFGDILENPTTFLATTLAEHPKVTESHVLEVSKQSCAEELAEMYARAEDRGRPCNFLHFGVSAIARALKLEQVGYNVADFRIPDECR